MAIGAERVVGQPLPRADGPAKLTGRERYAGDLALPGLLHARLTLSSEAHARITGRRRERGPPTTGRRRRADGRRSAVRARGRAAARAPSRWRASEALYAGQPVAVVLAEDEAIAAEAAALVQVDYEPLPVVVDLAGGDGAR